MQRKKLLKTIFGILLIGFCIILPIIGFWRRNKLENNHQTSYALISSCQNGGRGNAGSVFLNFNMTVNGKSYMSSSSYRTSELSFFDAQKYLVGKTFPAVYYPPNPRISSIMISPQDFARYGYQFPDSLSWVLQYFTK